MSGSGPGKPTSRPRKTLSVFSCANLTFSLCVCLCTCCDRVFSVRTTVSTMYHTVTITEDTVAEESRRLTKCETGVLVVVTLGCYLISAFGMWAIVKLAH